MRIRTQIKTFIFCLAAVGSLLGVLGCLLKTAHNRESESNALINHSAAVANALNEFSSAFDECESDSRSLINFGHSDGDLKTCRANVWKEFKRIEDLTKDNSSQSPNLQLLRFAIEQRFSDVDRLIVAYNEGGSPAVIAIVQTGATLANSRQVNAARGFVQKEESRLLIERGTSAEASRRRLNILSQTILALLTISIIVSIIVIWRSMQVQKRNEQRLREMYNKAVRDSANAVLDDSDFNETMENVAQFLDEKTEGKTK